MGIAFSEATNNTGIVQQVRAMVKLDSTQLPTSRLVNSCNNYLDTIAGYYIGNDKRFQWDDTNHTKLPIGTTNLVANQSDYSFLTDEQGNRILTLTRIDMLTSTGGNTYLQLEPIDQNQLQGIALPNFFQGTGTPQYYDKISDNIIRLYPTPSTAVTAGLRFYFQRTPSYFDADDTTKEPGVPAYLHRGFVIASAYDAALTEGLPQVQILAIELQRETQKMIEFFNTRNNDLIPNVIRPKKIDFI